MPIPKTIPVTMPPFIDVDDVIDAQMVAEVLGLAQRNTVSQYQRRYPDMPRPVIDLGQGRCKLWLRSEIVRWMRERSLTRRQTNHSRARRSGKAPAGRGLAGE
jgi:glutathione-regulated potassium-efflux system ancillary protein KefG